MHVNQVLTANRLSDGRVVFLTPGGEWSADLGAARVAADAAGQAELSEIGVDAEARCLVVGAYLIDVRMNRGQIEASEVREAIRAAGPTIQAGRF